MKNIVKAIKGKFGKGHKWTDRSDKELAEFWRKMYYAEFERNLKCMKGEN